MEDVRANGPERPWLTLNVSAEMKTYFLLILLFTTPVHAGWLEKAPWNTPAARCAFLLGMGSARGALVGGTGFEGFWPTEQHAAETFFAVAKLYAQDIGVSPQKLTTEEWKAEVATALEAKARETLPESGSDAEEAVAFVAGAYVRWGTPTGFRSSGDRTGYAIAQRISSLNEFSVQLLHQPGYPGGTTLTISGGGESPKEDFFRLMHQVEQAVRKEPNKSPEPMPLTRHGSP